MNKVNPHSLQSDELLLKTYAYLSGYLSRVQGDLGRIEQAILQRMEERGATAIPDETYRCEMHVSHTYQQPLLTPLLEVLNKVELDACYVPAHEELVKVDAKWRVQQLLAVARRRGAEALAIIERAKIESGRKLKFEKRIKE